MTFGAKILSLNFLTLALFFLDRWLKYFFELKGKIFINHYVAFGLKLDLNLIYILTGLILGLFIFWLIKSYSKKIILEIFGISLMFFGAISNLIDRILYGYVLDYINFPYFSIFNLADVMIVGGAIVLIYYFLIVKDKRVN